MALLFLAGGVWRVYDCYELELWIDEASSLETAQGTLVWAWNSALHFQLQPPAYFLLLNLWLRISPHVEFARLLSVLFALLSVWFVYRTWKHLFGDKFYWAAPAILMCHSLHLWASSEARGYAAVMLFAAASTYYFTKSLLKRAGQERPRAGVALYVLWSLLGLFTNYHVGFLLLGHFLATFIWFDRKTFVRLQAAYLVMVTILVFWLPVLQMQLSPRAPGNLLNPLVVPADLSFLYEFAFLLRPVYWIAKSVLFFPTASSFSKISMLTFLVLAATMVLALRINRGRGKLSQEESLFVVVYATPVFCLTMLSMFLSSLVSLRYYAVALPGFVLLICSICCNFQNRKTTLALLGGIIGILLSCSVIHEASFSKGNWRKLCRYLEAKERPEDLIIFFNSIAYKPLFKCYYRGSNPLHALPQEPAYDRKDPQKRMIRNEAQIIAFFEKRKSTTGRIWLIGREDTFGPEAGGFELNGAILKKYLEERYELVQEQLFANTAVVRLFVSKTENR